MNEKRRQDPGEGFVSAYVLQSDADPQEVWVVGLFENREVYRKNAEAPTTDAQYREMRQHLEVDPEWHDGEVVFSQGAGANR